MNHPTIDFIFNGQNWYSLSQLNKQGKILHTFSNTPNNDPIFVHWLQGVRPFGWTQFPCDLNQRRPIPTWEVHRIPRFFPRSRFTNQNSMWSITFCCISKFKLNQILHANLQFKQKYTVSKYCIENMSIISISSSVHYLQIDLKICITIFIWKLNTYIYICIHTYTYTYIYNLYTYEYIYIYNLYTYEYIYK